MVLLCVTGVGKGILRAWFSLLDIMSPLPLCISYSLHKHTCIYALLKRHMRMVFTVSRLTGITSDHDQQVQLFVSLRRIIETKEVVTLWYLRRTPKPRRKIRQSETEKSGV